MSTRKDFKMLEEAYSDVGGMSLTPSNMLGGKPVMITMDMPGAEVDHDAQESHGEEHNKHKGCGGENDPSEIEMASAELHKLAEYAPKLKEMISQMSGLEGWVASKITKASDYISSVYHWLEYQQHEGNEGCDHNHEEEDMYNTGYEEVDECPYAKVGCTCGGCSYCH
jgi:hypothetical protein